MAVGEELGVGEVEGDGEEGEVFEGDDEGGGGGGCAGEVAGE